MSQIDFLALMALGDFAFGLVNDVFCVLAGNFDIVKDLTNVVVCDVFVLMGYHDWRLIYGGKELPSATLSRHSLKEVLSIWFSFSRGAKVLL